VTLDTFPRRRFPPGTRRMFSSRGAVLLDRLLRRGGVPEHPGGVPRERGWRLPPALRAGASAPQKGDTPHGFSHGASRRQRLAGKRATYPVSSRATGCRCPQLLGASKRTANVVRQDGLFLATPEHSIGCAGALGRSRPHTGSAPERTSVLCHVDCLPARGQSSPYLQAGTSHPRKVCADSKHSAPWVALR